MGIGITTSLFHVYGHLVKARRALYIWVRGIASISADGPTRLFGMSPGTVLLGFLYFLILVAISDSMTCGIRTSLIRDCGISSVSNALASFVMLVKWTESSSANNSGLLFGSRSDKDHSGGHHHQRSYLVLYTRMRYAQLLSVYQFLSQSKRLS